MDRRAQRWALVATSLGFAVVQLDVSVVNVAIEPIGTALGSGVSGLQWVVNAYTVAFASLILTAGALGDRVGAKRVFIGGFALFTLASAGCGLAPTLGVLIGARIVQGLGAAILVPCSLSLLTHAFPDAGARGRAVGLWAAGASVALSGGPLVGGLLTSTLGWRAIFFINAPIGAVGIGLTAKYAQETSRSRDRGVDLSGQVLVVVTLLALAGAMVEAGRIGFGSRWVLTGFVVAALGAVAFVLVERRTTRPMLPLGLFASRTFSACAACGLVINIAFYGLIFVLSLYFQLARGYSPLQTGLAFAPATAVVFAANVLAGRWAGSVGARRVVMSGALILAVGLAGLLVIGDHTAYPAIVVQLMAVGFGLGLIVPAITTALLGSVEASRSGVASGTLNTARQVGSVVGVALMGSLAAGGLVSGVRVGVVVALALAVVTGGLGSLIVQDG